MVYKDKEKEIEFWKVHSQAMGMVNEQGILVNKTKRDSADKIAEAESSVHLAKDELQEFLKGKFGTKVKKVLKKQARTLKSLKDGD